MDAYKSLVEDCPEEPREMIQRYNLKFLFLTTTLLMIGRLAGNIAPKLKLNKLADPFVSHVARQPVSLFSTEIGEEGTMTISKAGHPLLNRTNFKLRQSADAIQVRYG